MAHLNAVILYQAVLNQKFTDCFVLVFLDSQAGKTVSCSKCVSKVTKKHFFNPPALHRA